MWGYPTSNISQMWGYPTSNYFPNVGVSYFKLFPKCGGILLQTISQMWRYPTSNYLSNVQKEVYLQKKHFYPKRCKCSNQIIIQTQHSSNCFLNVQTELFFIQAQLQTIS